MKGKNYRVIVKRDDTQNDLRSYAYAPIVNGNSDTNNIVMSYAVQNLQYKRLEKQCKSSFHNNTINLKFNNNYKK